MIKKILPPLLLSLLLLSPSLIQAIDLPKIKITPFEDINPEHLYYESTSNFYNSQIIEGYPSGFVGENRVFEADQPVNRAEFVKILLKAIGEKESDNNCFPDVTNQWFAPYVCRAYQLGIIIGYSDDTFKPERPIHFVEAAKILAKSFQLPLDTSTPDIWYEPYIIALEKSHAIPKNVRFAAPVTRGQMVEMAWRLKQSIKNKPFQTYEELTNTKPGNFGQSQIAATKTQKIPSKICDDFQNCYHAFDNNGRIDRLYEENYLYISEYGEYSKKVDEHDNEALVVDKNYNVFFIDYLGNRTSTDYDWTFKINNLPGVMIDDRKWEPIFPSENDKYQWPQVGALKDGRAVALTQKDISKCPEINIYSGFTSINPFTEMYVSQSEQFHIDSNGKRAYPENYQKVGEYSEGRAIVQDSSGQSFHIDLNGKRLYPENYVELRNFKEERAAVMDANGKYFHIDLNGQKAYDTTFNGKVWDYKNGIARASNGPTDWFHINLNGKHLYPESYAWVDDFYEDRARVKDTKGNRFHIDTSGKHLYPENYAWVDNFQNGRARVMDFDNNWFHIDLSGKRLNQQSYAAIDSFHQATAIKLDFIDETQATENGITWSVQGQKTVLPFYPNGELAAEIYSLGLLSRVKDQDGNWFYINAAGNRISDQNFLSENDDNYYIFYGYKDGLFYVVDHHNQISDYYKFETTLSDKLPFEPTQNLPTDFCHPTKNPSDKCQILLIPEILAQTKALKNILSQSQQPGEENCPYLSNQAIFYDGRAITEDENSNAYHITTNHKRAYEQNYKKVRNYSQGRSLVEDKSGYYHFIDINGNIIEDFFFLEFGQPENGLTPIVDNYHNRLYLNEAGTPVGKTPCLGICLTSQ